MDSFIFTARPEPEPDEQRLTELYVYPGEDVRQKEGDTLVLDCLSSDPAVRVRWESPPGAQPSRPGQDATPGRLIIESARPEDTGVYTCRAESSDPGVPPSSKSVRAVIEPGISTNDCLTK